MKKLVAREFNLPQHEVLESWMRSLSALRNQCAHHARLWNRYLNATNERPHAWQLGYEPPDGREQTLRRALLHIGSTL